MGDLPHAGSLTQTQRITEPDIGLRTVGAAPRQVDQRVAKRDVFPGADAELRNRKADLTSPRGEPVLESLRIIADSSQRRRKIELNQVISSARHHSVGVLGSHGFRQPSITDRTCASEGGSMISPAMTPLLFTSIEIIRFLSRRG